MNEIVQKHVLAPSIVLFEIYNPIISKKAKPGQFVIVRKDEYAERIPLTIVDYNPEKGTVILIVQEVGWSTKKICALSEGERFEDVLGPLGHPSEIRYFGKVACVGGGVGVAPLYPILKALKEAGNEVISIIGARTKEFLIFLSEIEAMSHQLYVCTDDGSFGFKGFVSEKLSELIHSGEKIDRVWAIGPGVMMEAVCRVTRPFGIPTIVSLNPIMVDGTGMCGGCRITVGNETKFVCVDGPEFDGHLVKFEELHQRTRMYIPYEKKALEMHTCKLQFIK